MPQSERIATFDDDGTLWPEQPQGAELAFTLDRLRELAPAHPEWKRKEPFKSALGGKVSNPLPLLAALHDGMTTTDFAQTVRRWLSTAKHPRCGRPYTECLYQPMHEVLGFFRDNGFQTFIASSGELDFTRVLAEELYGIPPEQVVGTTTELRFELREGNPGLVREVAVFPTGDEARKPVAVQQHVGRRPIATFGNSDGDQQLLAWTATGPGARLLVLVHHTDAEREVAYDRASPIGKLDRALDEAKAKAWTVVSMKDDWKTVFPLPPPALPAPPATKPPAAAPVGQSDALAIPASG